MNFKVLITISLSFFCLNSFSQKRYNGYLFKNSGQEVSTRDSADYTRIVSEPDSGEFLFNVSEFYMNGQPKFIGMTSKVEPLRLEGQSISYYASGKKQEIANYVNGIRRGDAFCYFPNGKPYTHIKYLSLNEYVEGRDKYTVVSCNDSTGKILVNDGNGYYTGYDADFKFIKEEGDIKDGLKNGKWKGRQIVKGGSLSFNEEYNEGKLVYGRSVYQNKKTYLYTNREELPQYKNGLDAFYHFIADHLQYPDRAKKDNITGRVYVAFIVEADGSIADVKVTQSPSSDLSAEARRVVKSTPNWIPGKQFGIPVRVQYTVPISFTLSSTPY
jgi:TonB family protein